VQPITILVVEDNEVQRKVIEFNVSRAGYTAIGAGTIGEAFMLMKQYKPALVITDVMLPDGNGIELLEKLLSINPELAVIAITAYGTIRMAVDAIKKGAYDYITKPFEKEELLLSIQQALKDKGTILHNPGYGIVGTSPAIREILGTIKHIADSDVPVLITGESGTGKEVMARAIHNTGNRHDKTFMAINCAALPSSLLEAELFGYTRGAFTGAVKDKPGKFTRADNGTLFLDEIGSMDITVQPKILRVLETGYVERLGDVEGKKVDTRIVSATNADLPGLIQKGIFREDLYYRLNVVHIHIPPLRERREDIKPLVRHFLNEYSRGGKLVIGNEAMDRIVNHPWYGNVRELQNFIRRIAVIKGAGTITGHDVESNLSPSVSLHGPASSGADESMDEAEKRMIISALDKAGYNMSKAAKILKIPRHKLIYRLKKYQIDMKAAVKKE
jgi:two-component system NtrC family response regulator